MKPTTLWALARAGSARARQRAFTGGMAARRLALTAAALNTGVLDALARHAISQEQLAERLGFTNDGVLEGFLRVLEADGLIRGSRGSWRLTRLGAGLVDDDVARAMVECFDGYHAGLYRDLAEQLRGGSPRTDITDSAGLIARLSQVMEPLIFDELTKVLSEQHPGLVLDVGCGSGSLLAHLLASAPTARGVGIDSAVAAMAAKTLAEAGVSGRAELAAGDAADLLAGGDLVAAGSVDLAVAANVVYYLPTPRLRRLLAAIAETLRPGGVLVVITTELEDSLNSRHFDLLLRAQSAPTGLFPRGELIDELSRSGLQVGRIKRLAPGESLVAVHARRPAALSV